MPLADEFDALTRNVGVVALKCRNEEIVIGLDLKDRDVVLDCGCGDCIHYAVIQKIFKCNVIGLDRSLPTLRLLQSYISNFIIPKILSGNAQQFPFPDSEFTKIYSSEMLEHVPMPDEVLEEIRRILKTGGLLLMTVPNQKYPVVLDPWN